MTFCGSFYVFNKFRVCVAKYIICDSLFVENAVCTNLNNQINILSKMFKCISKTKTNIF